MGQPIWIPKSHQDGSVRAAEAFATFQKLTGACLYGILQAMTTSHSLLRWVVVLYLTLSPMVVQAVCRQALALGLDVSASIDNGEFELQMKGLAKALLAEEVQRAFQAFPEAPVRLYVFIWAGQGGPLTILPWTEIENETDLVEVANVLNSQIRQRFSSKTALGEAMNFGRNALQTQNECWRLTLDISGDGKSNTGVRPSDFRLTSSLTDITINALAVGQEYTFLLGARDRDNADLVDYFETNVIHGPDAFVEIAIGFHDFEEAMERKLLKELHLLSVVSLGMEPQELFRASNLKKAATSRGYGVPGK